MISVNHAKGCGAAQGRVRPLDGGRSMSAEAERQNEPIREKPNDYSFASFGITSALNSCSERSASASDMVPRKR
jgi:hypothetical protein